MGEDLSVGGRGHRLYENRAAKQREYRGRKKRALERASLERTMHPMKESVVSEVVDGYDVVAEPVVHLTKTAKQIDAAAWRIQGLSYREIAARMGWKSDNSARKAVERGLMEEGTSDNVLELELARLDRLLPESVSRFTETDGAAR
ncbi:MAG: hypothetical protein HYZ57_20530 [Acidobacteria bacterium]|nr:hypothetical protein [Acidobacteriota bacterium]